MLTLVIFLAILAVLVLSHEFGHFIVARRSGIKVEEFGFGFPPRLFGIQLFKEQKLEKIAEQEEVELQVTSYKLQDGQEASEKIITDTTREIDAVVAEKKWRFVWGAKGVEKLRAENIGREGTVYSVNLIPLGGFVKIKGENGEAPDEADSFGAKKPWQKALVMAAGVAMNILLAAVLLSVGFMVGLPQMTDNLPEGSIVKNRRTEILQVFSGKPAALADLRAGDALLKVGGLDNPRVKEIQEYVNAHRGEDVTVVIRRGEEIFTKQIKPAVYEGTGRAGLGVAIAEVGEVRYAWYKAIYYGFTGSFLYLKEIVVALFLLVKGLLAGAAVAGEVTGPVGIAVMTGRVARLGFAYLVQFTAVLSLNLAVINILPIPALDGGRLLFLLISKIRRREMSQKVETAIHLVGFCALMALVILVTVKDVGAFRDNFVNFFQRIF